MSPTHQRPGDLKHQPAAAGQAMGELEGADIKRVTWNSDVYEPSDDSFLLVDALLQLLPTMQPLPRIAAEIGCGSGYVICSLAVALRALQHQCALIATDINPAALAATAATLQAHNLQDAVQLLQTDLFTGVQSPAPALPPVFLATATQPTSCTPAAAHPAAVQRPAAGPLQPPPAAATEPGGPLADKAYHRPLSNSSMAPQAPSAAAIIATSPTCPGPKLSCNHSAPGMVNSAGEGSSNPASSNPASSNPASSNPASSSSSSSSNTGSSAQGFVDLLLFNPPYVPTPDEEVERGGIAAAWAGGMRGRRVIDRVLPQLDAILAPGGHMLMVTVAENDPGGIISGCAARGYEGRVVMRRGADEEALSIVWLRRPGASG